MKRTTISVPGGTRVPASGACSRAMPLPTTLPASRGPRPLDHARAAAAPVKDGTATRSLASTTTEPLRAAAPEARHRATQGGGFAAAAWARGSSPLAQNAASTFLTEARRDVRRWWRRPIGGEPTGYRVHRACTQSAQQRTRAQRIVRRQVVHFGEQRRSGRSVFLLAERPPAAVFLHPCQRLRSSDRLIVRHAQVLKHLLRQLLKHRRARRRAEVLPSVG